MNRDRIKGIFYLRTTKNPCRKKENLSDWKSDETTKKLGLSQMARLSCKYEYLCTSAIGCLHDVVQAGFLIFM